MVGVNRGVYISEIFSCGAYQEETIELSIGERSVCFVLVECVLCR